MKENLILKDVGQSSNIYGASYRYGSYNPPQNLQFIPSKPSLDNLNYEFRISNSKLEGCNKFSLIITLLEIKGVGKVAYYKNFGILAVKSFEIFINDILIKSMTSEEILMNYEPNSRSEKILGNTEEYCEIKEGFNDDYVIFNKFDVIIPIITCFDTVDPHTILRLNKADVLTVKVEFNPIENLIAYNRTFAQRIVTLKNEFNSVGYNPQLCFQGYNTLNSNCINRFIEQLEECKSKDSSTSFSTNEFSSCTSLSAFAKTDDFINKYHIAFPGLDTSEKNIINSFVQRLIRDLIVVASSEEVLKRYFPENADFIEVEDNKVNKCQIYIENVPEDQKVFFNNKILTFSRRGNIHLEYNLSYKFKKIVGIYLPMCDKKEEERADISIRDDSIHFLKIEHDITILDASIPVENWDITYNESLKDMRSFKSKEDDMFINNPFIIGIDYVNKDCGFKNILVKSGNSDILSTDIYYPQINFYDNKLYYCPKPLDDNQYPNIGYFKFNSNPILSIEPARISSNKDINFVNFQIHPTWNEYDINNPKQLTKKYLHVFLSKLKFISYDKNTVEIYDVDSDIYRQKIKDLI